MTVGLYDPWAAPIAPTDYLLDSDLPYTNVKSAGALGDGVNDDTAAIQSAINGVTFTSQSTGRKIIFPKGTYKITSTIEVPPNVWLEGVATFSTTTNGSTINVTHDGVGVRLVRRNSAAAAGSGLWHMGGVTTMGFNGTGGSATSAQRLIEIGDSRAFSGTVTATNGSPNIVGAGTQFTIDVVAGDTVMVNGVSMSVLSVTDDTHLALTANWGGSTSAGYEWLVISNGGAWMPLIYNCNFNFSAGYAIYVAHAQEPTIFRNRMTNVKFPIYFRHVIASAHIIRNTITDEAAVAWLDGAIGVELRKGGGGGNVSAEIHGNYFLGFDKQVWCAQVNGVAIKGNAFEAPNRDCIGLSKYLSNEVGLESASAVGCEGCTIEGNSFLGWSATIAGGAAIRISYSRENTVGRNQYQAPNAANAGATPAIVLYDGGDGSCKDNYIVVPGKPNGSGLYVVSDGLGGSSTVRSIDVNNATVAQNVLQHSDWYQPKSLASDPDTTGWGAGEKGRSWFNSTSNKLKFWNGSAPETVTSA